MSLESLIAELKSIGAHFEPVDDSPSSGQDLERIPPEYREFLKIANGLQVSGLRLLGTKPMLLAGGHIENDIFTATLDAQDQNWVSRGAVLGQISSDLLIIYREDDRHYQLLDKSCGDILYTFPTLLEVLEQWKKWHRHLFHA